MAQHQKANCTICILPRLREYGLPVFQPRADLAREADDLDLLDSTLLEFALLPVLERNTPQQHRDH